MTSEDNALKKHKPITNLPKLFIVVLIYQGLVEYVYPYYDECAANERLIKWQQTKVIGSGEIVFDEATNGSRVFEVYLMEKVS